MRALVPEPADDVDLHQFYGADWLESGGLRMNFVSSVDGAATAAGLSAGLQTAGDNAIYRILRDLADVVLVGAGTARAEGYRPVRAAGDRQERRLRYGLPARLPIAIVTRSLNVDPDAELFIGAHPEARTIVLTCADTNTETRRRLAEVAEVVICGERAVDLTVARRELETRSLRRILCEGGPTLFGDLVQADVVDQLCLSVTAALVGPGAPRIVAGDIPWAGLVKLHLTGLLEDEGSLFCRYALERRHN